MLFGWFGARKDGVEEGGEAVDGFGGDFWRGRGISGGGGMRGGGGGYGGGWVMMR